MTVGFGSQRLDAFPRFLLGRARIARRRNIMAFTLTHPTGDQLEVYLGPPDRITVIRYPKASIPGPVLGKARMRLATSEHELVHDLATGLTSSQSEIWRG